MEEYRTGTGQVLEVHDQDLCAGQWCVIHRPKPGVWDRWPTFWRFDRRIMERICPHGIGHPAVEQFDHWRATDQWWQATHGCDGCCGGTTKTREQFPGKVWDVDED